jgi:hypothetical protein
MSAIKQLTADPVNENFATVLSNLILFPSDGYFVMIFCLPECDGQTAEYFL